MIYDLMPKPNNPFRSRWVLRKLVSNSGMWVRLGAHSAARKYKCSHEFLEVLVKKKWKKITIRFIVTWKTCLSISYRQTIFCLLSWNSVVELIASSTKSKGKQWLARNTTKGFITDTLLMILIRKHWRYTKPATFQIYEKTETTRMNVTKKILKNHLRWKVPMSNQQKKVKRITTDPVSYKTITSIPKRCVVIMAKLRRIQFPFEYKPMFL